MFCLSVELLSQKNKKNKKYSLNWNVSNFDYLFFVISLIFESMTSSFQNIILQYMCIICMNIQHFVAFSVENVQYKYSRFDN